MKTTQFSSNHAAQKNIVNQHSIVSPDFTGAKALLTYKLKNFSKLAALYLGVTSILFLVACVFISLFLRALDIQDQEKYAVLEQHEKYLEIQHPHDAPKGE